MPQPHRQLCDQALQQVLFQHEPHKEVQPPENEIPTGPMPEAGTEPDDENIPHRPPVPLPAAAQGDIQVLPEPGGQGDVPPPPELRDGGGSIGIVKVLREVEAQHLTHADGHIGIAGKIKVDLEAVGRDAQPAAEGRQGPGGLGRQLRVPQGADAVGQQHLFCKAHGEPLGPGSKFIHRVGPVVQLRRHIPVPDDGPRHQLGEHGHVSAEGHHIPLGGGVLPVDINGVAHGLESEKGDADGQGQSQGRNGDTGDQGQVGGKEIPVFEETQQPQIQDHALRHEPPSQLVPAAVLLHQHPVGIVNEDGQHHNDDIHRFPPAIEHQAGQQQGQIPPSQGNGEVNG